MRILAIETSCDDTGVAILEASGGKNSDFKVLSNLVSSQTIHQNYGGVFPMMAKREHQNNLVPVLTSALKQAKLLKIKNAKISAKGGSAYGRKNQNDNVKFKIIETILSREQDLYKKINLFLQKYEKPEIDLIAVTNGPGLEPCLWVGVNFTKALSYFWNIPIIPVNHIEAHIVVNFLPKINENPKSEIRNPKWFSFTHHLEFAEGQIQNSNFKIESLFPAICLIVSGGHTQLILMRGIGKYKIIGETRDDAAGECFDKCAKILGLEYPGGPIISEIAAMADNPSIPIKLPRPMINSNNYDFSFSGLKTAVLYEIRKIHPEKLKDKKFIGEACAEVQQAIIDVLVKKTIKAAKDFGAKTIILGGGVSANDELRKQFNYELSTMNHQLNFLVPPKNLSTDNALMIAVAGYFHKNKKTKNWKKIRAKANLRISK